MGRRLTNLFVSLIIVFSICIINIPVHAEDESNTYDTATIIAITDEQESGNISILDVGNEIIDETYVQQWYFLYVKENDFLYAVLLLDSENLIGIYAKDGQLYTGETLSDGVQLYSEENGGYSVMGNPCYRENEDEVVLEKIVVEGPENTESEENIEEEPEESEESIEESTEISMLSLDEESKTEESANSSLPTIRYTTHISDIGWMSAVENGEIGGVLGESRRLEAINIVLDTTEDLSLSYRAHVQDVGWESTWKEEGQNSGTTGRSLRLEAIQIALTGSDSSKYDIYYTTYVQGFGWMAWAKNGEQAGSQGKSLRVEAIRIEIVEKNANSPENLGNIDYCFANNSGNKGSTLALSVTTHVQNIGWMSPVGIDGTTFAGTTGKSLRLEAIKLTILQSNYDGTIEYQSHIQDYGWESDWKSAGMISGTTGKSLRLEAIKFRLTGELAEMYDIYYQTHVQEIGWTGWAKNGEVSGSSGLSFRLEAIRVAIVEKGSNPPGTSNNAYYEVIGNFNGNQIVKTTNLLLAYRKSALNSDLMGAYMYNGVKYYFLSGVASRIRYVKENGVFYKYYDGEKSEVVSKGTVLVAQASGDENDDGYYGAAGNQSGYELNITTWADRDWTYVIRANDSATAEKIAVAMENAAMNLHIGYDQTQRNTLYTYASKVGFNPGLVTTNCETDCSALVSVALIYAGFSASEVYKSGNLRTTWTLATAIKSHGGFTFYSSSVFTGSTSKLKRGDILLNTGTHTAVVVQGN